MELIFSTKEIDSKWNGNGTEIEWKWNEIFSTKEMGCKMEGIWNGNKMEKIYHPALEVKLNGMEWKRNVNGVERLCQPVILIFDFGNGMESKWKWKWNS